MFFGGKKQENNEENAGKWKIWIILCGAVIGVALLLFGGQTKDEKIQAEGESYRPQEDELILYQSYLEERVASICRSVKGVDNVSVIVTLAGGFESVYATEMTDGNEEYVILGSGSSASALYLTRSAPQIAGIGIVCKGGSDTAVRAELLSLVSAAFHISFNRIYITEATA